MTDVRLDPRRHLAAATGVAVTLLVAALASACSDDATSASGTATGSTTGSTTSSTTSSTSTESTGADVSSSSTTGSTTEPTGCWREIDGDLIVDANTVLDDLRNIKSVTGTVLITMKEQPQEDLSFLECLESAHSLDFGESTYLRTTAGMTRLSSLTSIRGGGDGAPQVLEGFEGLTVLETISIDQGHAIERIDLPTIQQLTNLWIGGCNWGNGPPPEPPGSLTSLGNFESLEYLKTMAIYGNASLADASVLDSLIANGAPPPIGAGFVGNASLPSDEIIAKLETLGVTDYHLCGNLGDKPCACPLD